jgi:hypothetical protein
MANAELNPRDWRDIQVLRAQGVLAELLTVDLDQADRGLRAYAAMTGVSLHTVAQQVVDRELTISRELCVPAPAPRRPEQRPDRPPQAGGAESRRGRRTGVDRQAARADP